MRSLALILLAFLLARLFTSIVGVSKESGRWLWIWTLLTIAAFFSGHFLMFALIVTVACVVLARKYPDRVVMLYALLLPLVPTFGYTIPGPPGIGKILTINYAQVLALALLLPAYISARRVLKGGAVMRHGLDFFFLGYCGWLGLLEFVHMISFTNSLRGIVSTTLSLLIPYLAVSRLLRTPDQLRDVIVAIAFTGFVVAAVCVVEAVMARHPYLDLQWRWGTDPIPGFSYMPYFRFGLMRVSGTMQSGVGMFLIVSLASLLCLARMGGLVRWRVWLGVAILVGAIILTGSRAAWISTGIIVATGICFRYIQTPRRFMAAVVVSLLVLPYVRNLILGIQDDFGTFDYRQKLLDSSLPLVWEKPLLGWGSLLNLFASGRLNNMVQGQGIIDIVNTYLGEALARGIPGLIFFSGIMVFTVLTPLRSLQQLSSLQAEASRPLVAWTCSVALAAAFYLVTTSMIGHVGPYLFLTAAIASALGAMPDRMRREGALV